MRNDLIEELPNEDMTQRAIQPRSIRKLAWWVGALVVVASVVAVVMPILFKAAVLRPWSRIQNDLRSTNATISEYNKAEHRPPPMVPLSSFTSNTEELQKARAHKLMTTAPSPTDGLPGLTTPVAYRLSLQGGIFEPKVPFAYYTNGKEWLVYSTGPDTKYDITDPSGVLPLQGPQRATMLIKLTYDPTNGAISPGDIWLSGP